RSTVNAALDRRERERQGRAYPVGDGFGVADLTAAALLSPLLQPPGIQSPVRVELPPYLQDYRATVLLHPAAQWAVSIYRLHRGTSAELERRSAGGAGRGRRPSPRSPRPSRTGPPSSAPRSFFFPVAASPPPASPGPPSSEPLPAPARASP